MLYQLVQQHAAQFFEQASAASDAGLPKYIKDEFDAFLECGILSCGFLRLRCESGCGYDKLVAFSCKRRGFCPSCGAKRMSETAAHLVDQVIPAVPARQWALSLPIPLRLLLAAQPRHITVVLQVVQRVIARFLVKQSQAQGMQAKTGAVTLIQRFGSAANLNIHLHCLVLDGVYQQDDEGVPRFTQVKPPSDQEVRELLQIMITKLMKRLTRLGVVVQDEGVTYLADLADTGTGSQLCRYITRPALANERITINDQGQVILKLKSAWSDGMSHLVMSAQEFMQRLAALVPRPRLHLTRYHGVLAPNAKWRSLIVPDLAGEEPDTELQSANVQADVQSDTNADEGKPLRAKRYSWAKLLQRVFAIDMAHCPHCGANLRIIAAIVEQGVTNKILAHLAKQEERDQANQGSQSMARAPPVAGKASGYQQWLI